jgi:hypothetical protein
MNLADFLIAPRPVWDWRSHDCCRWVARWAVLNGTIDPMASIRDAYDDEASAMACIEAGGGLVPLWTRGAIEAGIPEADEARPGDIGIIARETECGTNEAAAIFGGARWITLAHRGIIAGPAEPLIVWRI